MSEGKFKKSKEVLKNCFVVKDEKWHNLKLQKVVAEYGETIEAIRKAGLASGVARRAKKEQMLNG